MLVTQDYKILTLTRAEWHAVRVALSEAEDQFKENWAFRPTKENAQLLASAQSALAKVRA